MISAIKGSRIYLDDNGEFKELELGYTPLRVEHSLGAEKTVSNINNDLSGVSEYKLKENKRLISRWDNTSYRGKVINPVAHTYMREIEVDNSCIPSDFRTIDNGRYWVLCIGVTKGKPLELFTIEDYENRLEGRRKIHEGELWAMIIHNDSTRLLGTAWDEYGIAIAVNKEYNGSNIVKSIMTALKSGNLALIDRANCGCVLVDLRKRHNVDKG